MSDSAIAAVLASLAEANISYSTDAAVVEAHSVDHTNTVKPGRAAALVRAKSTAQVQTVMRLASQHRVPVVPQGARTGLAGGATATDGALLLDLTAMNQVLSVDAPNRLAVVQPGVLNAEISQATKEHNLRYTPDPGSWEISTIGGNISTGAGGMCCVKYGVTSEYIQALEVVLANGDLMRCGRNTAKGVAGYDLVRLFVGSEGTLGVITEATVRLSPIPAQRLTLAAVFNSTAEAGAAVTSLMGAGLQPSLLELVDAVHMRAIEDMRPSGLPMDAAALLLAASDAANPEAELSAIAAHCEASGATEVHQATDAMEADALMQARRDALHAMEKKGAVLVDDIAVPRTALAQALDAVEEMSRKHGVTIGVIAHAGDGNLHPNIIVDMADPKSVAAGNAAFGEILDVALALGGTVTGEHGVGVLKRDWLRRELDPVNLRMQWAIKQAFDPQGILNPGKVLPSLE
ncbi:FAD-binding oxidoreductase [Natronoglycomyces albus]|uniref:FAD-binding protein n=1 Tax=Natronoglycomyces albus TaxID=2811108 RepID=A0A895XUK6_9ACTN|nr:FAD-linked oxidase C-terminal domain-containing protein [Natronoglycomyces albus]QSB05338.1 FAD-binding protein [Natronoglycomyces albus]